MIKILAACAMILLAAAPVIAEPLIIAHRGASSERPEHTLAAYQRAIDNGADYIEPDLVMTREGAFVARHENEISGTTDIAEHPEFADRRTTKVIDGIATTGWFTEDFTLAELQTLGAYERIPELRPNNATYDGQDTIPSLAEIIALVQAQPRPIGMAPELKHPTYYASIDLPMEEALADQLAEAGYTNENDPVLIQCFEIEPLKLLDIITGLRLVQLIATGGGPADHPELSYAAMTTLEGLATIAGYADFIAPDKALLIPRTADNELGAPTGLVEAAHDAGLGVIAWTFRPENYFLPASLRGDDNPRADGNLEAEISAYLAIGIDGLFADDVRPAIAARDAR